MLPACEMAAEALPLAALFGKMTRYVACSWEAHYVLIQMVSLGAAVPVPASWRITGRDMAPPAARKGVFLRQMCSLFLPLFLSRLTYMGT